jgi:FixJ family two-component response regulator
MGSRNKVNVAIVDDDASLCKAMSRLLAAAGIESATYASAESFLESPSRSELDCLVLDIQLGGMSGFELQQRLAAMGGGPPVVFITAHDEPEIRQQAERSGCVAYLQKTDSGEAVIEGVRRALASRIPKLSASVQ